MTSQRSYCYSFKFDPKKMARAYGANLPISFKKTYELCKFLRGKPLERAMRELDQIIDLKLPVPYTRYNKDVPHKKGIGAGRYPVKPAAYLKKILNNAINNAKQKGLDTSKMKILHLACHRAVSKEKTARGWPKGCHVEVVIGLSEEE